MKHSKYNGPKPIDYNSITEFTDYNERYHWRDEDYKMVWGKTKELFTGAMRFDDKSNSIFGGIEYANEIRFLYHKNGKVHRVIGPAIIIFEKKSLQCKRTIWYINDIRYNEEELFYAMQKDGIDMYNITPEDEVYLNMKFEKSYKL